MTMRTEWDPVSSGTSRDMIAACDEMRKTCPVAFSDALQHSVLGHADVLRVLSDPGTFSNRVSTRVTVPNGMDPPQHTAYRRLLDPYFNAEMLARFAPACREIAAALMKRLPADGELELMADLAEPFAV